ncbi:MAG: sporulation protein YqfD, partial [Eubacterium sp.]|nr:sporulation protein YqfD [Eubacterium sp.]
SSMRLPIFSNNFKANSSSSCFIWNVEIVGNDRISDPMLESYLENHNFKSGVMWSSIDRDLLCWDIMSEFEDISWVHINKTGTTARIEINETKLADKDGDENKLKGINVMRKELQTVAYREQKDMTISERRSYKQIKFFFADIPLYFDMQQGDISNQSESYLTIKNTVLPIGIIENEECFLSSVPKVLSDDELLALAEKKLTFLEEKELDGYEIINKSQEHQLDDDKCVISAAYIVRRK